ncbi:hypothetical protein [Paenibacillus sp. HB172176]|uniref:hypothetical protein n=1 Tax=Paenibacillus sp. HB172176 TaxID=2493690 RepID=UPI00143B0CB8|nr:hypothetical protein [Paenibacillus sp. HB172176]
MGRWLRRLIVTLLVLIVVAGGACWWFISYISPDEKLDMSYQSIDMGEKIMDMIGRRKLELVLTEADVNNLIKMNMKRELADNIVLDGAKFELEQDALHAVLNVNYHNLVPAQIDVDYRLEWKQPNIVLYPQAIAVKGIDLPLSMLEVVEAPIQLPAGNRVKIENVAFGPQEIRVKFKLQLFS